MTSREVGTVADIAFGQSGTVWFVGDWDSRSGWGSASLNLLTMHMVFISPKMDVLVRYMYRGKFHYAPVRDQRKIWDYMREIGIMECR